jgi:hypothetical protein
MGKVKSLLRDGIFAHAQLGHVEPAPKKRIDKSGEEIHTVKQDVCAGCKRVSLYCICSKRKVKGKK